MNQWKINQWWAQLTEKLAYQEYRDGVGPSPRAGKGGSDPPRSAAVPNVDYSTS